MLHKNMFKLKHVIFLITYSTYDNYLISNEIFIKLKEFYLLFILYTIWFHPFILLITMFCN